MQGDRGPRPRRRRAASVRRSRSHFAIRESVSTNALIRDDRAESTESAAKTEWVITKPDGTTEPPVIVPPPFRPGSGPVATGAGNIVGTLRHRVPRSTATWSLVTARPPACFGLVSRYNLRLDPRVHGSGRPGSGIWLRGSPGVFPPLPTAYIKPKLSESTMPRPVHRTPFTGSSQRRWW